MGGVEIDVAYQSTTTYRIRIEGSDTSLVVQCDSSALRTLKACIERTLDDEPGLVSCQLHADCAAAFYPLLEETGGTSRRFVVNAEDATASTTLDRHQLEELAVHSIESALALSH